MKKIRVAFGICFLIFVSFGAVCSQEDEIYQSGLPIKIGETSGNPNRGNLSGKITLEGFDRSQPKPVIFVVVLFNGVFFDKRQALDNGSYFVPNVPRENVIVTVEVNGMEVARQLLTGSIMRGIRQDFNVLMPRSLTKTGVLTAKILYERIPENERLFEKATTAEKSKKLDEAVVLLSQIVENDPKDFVAWNELGTAYFRLEKHSEAEQSYISALSQKPDFMVTLLNLGKVYLTQKQLEKAIQILLKAVAVDQTNVDALHYLGEAFLQNKQGNNTAILFNEALRLAPFEKAELHLRLAWLYNAKGYKDKAAEEYRQYLKKIPNSPDKVKIEKYIKENSRK